MKRQLPQAEAPEAAGRHSSDSSGPHPSRPRVECPSAEGSDAQDGCSPPVPVTDSARNKVLRLAAQLYTCHEDTLPSSLADLKNAMTELEGITGISGAEPCSDKPIGSHSEVFSSILSALDESEQRELGLETEFTIDQRKLETLVSDYVIMHEAEAERMMEEFSTGAGTTAAAFTTFKNTSMKVGAIRLAVFTGKRFLYSSCAGVDGSRQTEALAPLRCNEPIEIPACASELELFLKVLKGRPPEKVALKAAMGLFSTIEYSMATPLNGIWIQGLAPALTQLSDKQMAVVVAAILGYSLCSSLAESSRLTVLLFLLSTWEDALKGAADNASESAASNAKNVTDCPEAAIFASKLLEKAGSGDPAHVKGLLQICRAECAPRWLKAGSIAASLCCVKQAPTDLTEECCSTLRDMLLNCSGRFVACVLGDAYKRASHQTRDHVAALTLTMAQHVADESHKRYLWLTEQTLVDRSVLSEPANKDALAPLICLPLQRKNCFLLVARMSFKRMTTANRSWAIKATFRSNLEKKVSCSDVDLPAQVPHVGLYLHNVLHYARKVQFALGFMPVHDVEQVVLVLRAVGKTFITEGFKGLKSEVISETAVFLQAVTSTVPPLRRRGCSCFRHVQTVSDKWAQMAGTGWHGSKTKHKEVVAFCVVDDSAA